MKPSTQQEYERRVLRAQQLVEAHLDETLSPTEVARSAGMSLHHFHRVFRGMTGETVMGFTRRLRLERAARSLRDSERDVLPIALDAGYQSHEAFTRAFSEAFGVPPSTYRSLQAAPEHRRTCTVTAFDTVPSACATMCCTSLGCCVDDQTVTSSSSPGMANAIWPSR